MASLACHPSLLVIFLMSLSLMPLTTPLETRFLQASPKTHPTIQSSLTQMTPIDKTAPSSVSVSIETIHNSQSSISPTMTPPTKELFPLLPFYLLMTFPDEMMIENTTDVDKDLDSYFNYTLLANIIDTHLSFHFAQNYKNGTFISLQTSVEPFSDRRRRHLYLDHDNHYRRRLSLKATMAVVGNVSVAGITPTIISIHKIQESAFINSPLNILFEMIQSSGDAFLERIRSLSAVYSIDDISFSSFDEEIIESTTMESNKKKSWNWIVILIGLLVGVMAMTTIGVILIYRQTKRNKKNNKSMEMEMKRKQRCDGDKDDDGVSAVSSSAYDNDNKSEYSEGVHSYAYSLEGANVPLSKYTKYPYNGDDGSLFSFASGITSGNASHRNMKNSNRQNSFHEEEESSVWSFGKVGVENSLSMDTCDITESIVENPMTCNNKDRDDSHNMTTTVFDSNNNTSNNRRRSSLSSSSSGDGQGEDSTTSASSQGDEENNTDNEQWSYTDDVVDKSSSLPLKRSLTTESYEKVSSLTKDDNIECDQPRINNGDIVSCDTFQYDQDRLKTLEERREEERLQIYGVRQQQQQHQDEDTISVDSIDKPMRTRGEIVASPLHKKPPLGQKRPYSNYSLSINTNQGCNIETNNESLAVITPDHPTPTVSKHYSNPPPSTITTSPSPPSSCYSSPQRAYSSSPLGGKRSYNKQNYHLSDEPPLETIKNNTSTPPRQQQQYQQRYQNNRHTSAPHIITAPSSSSPSHTSHHHYRRTHTPEPDLREKSQIRSFSVPPSSPSQPSLTTQRQQQHQQLTPRSISPTSSYGNSSSVATPLAENRSIIVSKKKQPYNDNAVDNPVIIIDAPFDEVCGKVGRGTKKSYFEGVYKSEI